METTRDINRALVNGIPFESGNEEQTAALAARLAAILPPGAVLSLEGDLGAGKTMFSRAFARALGIESPVTSPTFVIQKIYDAPGRPDVARLIHYDLYRIGSPDELIDLGFAESVPDAITLVEWGNLFLSEFPASPVRVQFRSIGENSRLMTVTGLGGDQKSCLKNR